MLNPFCICLVRESSSYNSGPNCDIMGEEPSLLSLKVKRILIKMDISINYFGITELMQKAESEGRDFLYEYEVYLLLANLGAETPPTTLFIPRGARSTDEELLTLPGEKVVLKIVSPAIIHKSEVGGVRVIEKEADRIRSTVRRMIYEVPEQYATLVERNPETFFAEYAGLAGEELVTAIRDDIKGVLQVQYMQPDSEAFGNELIVGLRNTREFGMVLSAGLGGTDTELYASRFRKGQAIVAASTAMVDGNTFFDLFRQTIAYQKLAGLTRGQRRIVTDEQLVECFEAFIRVANYYSPENAAAEFIIEELEVNPFAFSDYLMVPLDGMCRFSLGKAQPLKRTCTQIESLLHPGCIGIIGVSGSRRNFGRIILDNIQAEGFSADDIVVIRETHGEIGGVRCVGGLEELDEKLDLFIVAVGAEQLPALIAQIIELDVAESVMLISAGLGETTESRERADLVINMIEAAHSSGSGGPVFLGANCMGVISKVGRYDSWFIPEEKLPRNRDGNFHRAALISQSGAFMLHRSDQCPELKPAYMVSMGNQTDLTLGDMVQYFKTSGEIDVIAVYAEGFKDLDGLNFIRGVRDAVLAGKEVIFYKAGRTKEGKAATSGHTASLAGDYMVCENCVRQAGAIVARSFTEFQELFYLAETFSTKIIHGNRLAAISGAGFEAVGMADSIDSDDYHMQLADFSDQTQDILQSLFDANGLAELVTIANPLDITPTADDLLHGKVAETLLSDEGVDAVVISLVPLSPVMHTLSGGGETPFDMESDESVKNLIIKVAGKSEKPLVTVVDGGSLYDPLRRALIESGIPVFTVCDRAVGALSLYIQGRLAAESLRRSK